MEFGNTYMSHNNVLIHIIELNIVLSQDFIFSLKGPTSGKTKNVANGVIFYQFNTCDYDIEQVR